MMNAFIQYPQMPEIPPGIRDTTRDDQILGGLFLAGVFIAIGLLSIRMVRMLILLLLMLGFGVLALALTVHFHVIGAVGALILAFICGFALVLMD